jgi:import receptor subunit TOM22
MMGGRSGFTDKPAAPKHDALLVSDDEDYSDTG